MRILNNLKIKIFADGANIIDMHKLNNINYISGFTTNPSLMSQSKINNYRTFANEILKKINKKPVSFEVTADSFSEMEKQAYQIYSWSDNIFVKIPFTNSKGQKTLALIKKLSKNGLKLNITSLFTYDQVMQVIKVLNIDSETIISIFAGRIADTGRDPSLTIKKSVIAIKKYKKIKILWASCREIYNIFEADKIGCHIITVPHSIIKKFSLIGKNLDKYSIETARDFYLDSKKIKI
jgi:transaldolase